MNDEYPKKLQLFLEQTATKVFLSAARQFVNLLENENVSKEDFFAKAHTSLLELYAAGHKLDLIDLEHPQNEKEFDRNKIFDNKNAGIIDALKAEAFYWEVFDPTYSESDGKPNPGWTITDREASQGWLTDDFSDIYRDLKIELTKIDTIGTAEAVEDALWQMKFSFSTHWGIHAINALRYLHHLRYQGKKNS